MSATSSKLGLVGVYVRVLALLAPEKNLATTLALANVALAGLQFLEPILFGRIIEALVQVQENKSDPWTNILQLIGIWAGAGVITIGATVLVSLHADRLSHRRRLAAKEIFLEKALEQSLSFFGRDHSGRLIKVMQLGADTLFGVWLSLLREHLSTIVCLVLLLPLSIYINWQLGLVLAPMLVISMVLSWYVAGRTEQGQRAVEADHSAMAAQTGDALTNIALVQSFVRAEEELEAVRATARRLLAAQYPVLNWWAATTVLTRMMATMTLIALFLVGAWLHLQGKAKVGDIVTFMGFATMLIGRVEAALGFINRLFFEAPALEEYFTILEAEPAVKDRPNAKDVGRVQGRIAFESVTFAYPAAKTGVRGLDFVVEPGQSVALVGESGAGKSTALSLLSRFNEPQSGRIVIDSTDIAEAKLSSLRRNIAVVFQDSPLFNRTIRENLRVGKPNATDEEIIAAAKRARAYDFIMATDKGFDTPVGERGMTLSGGERQRLNIARAFLKNAPILILDEATSALDAVTEQEVQGALSDLMQGRTTFIIAHRLSTIRHANLVLVLDGGIIVERGTFEHLRTNGRIFRRLVEAQMIQAEE